MSRPYFNFISKDRTLPSVNTGIKRWDINTAIEKSLLLRDDNITTKMTCLQNAKNQLLRLPPEIRNKIYSFALDIGSAPASSTRVPYPSGDQRTQCSSIGALCLCKQISVEASSLMKAFDVAYVPVMASMDYAELIDNVLRHGLSSLSSIQHTMFVALTTFKHIHLHLHVSYRMSSDESDEEPYLDTKTAYIYGRIRQVLLIYSCASALASQQLGTNSIKRKAVLHLDHLFSDWHHMLTMAGCYSFKHLVRIMGDDKNTDWELRYYVHAGGQRKARYWAEWDERLTRIFLSLEKECSNFSNIKLVAEVYGNLTWSLEGKVAEVTRSISPSSTLWPSWPDDVPWRRYERVRSDEAVSLGDVSLRAGSSE
ncbi:Nn.00g063520.m01.CDS01 [Neocucurbitaria sp. VM-36]